MSLLLILRSPDDDATTDLTSLAAVKRLLQKPAGDTSQDALLTDLITEASVMLERELAREFHPVAAQTRVFSYNGYGQIDFAPSEARAVSAVTYDYGDTGVALAGPGGWTLTESDVFAGTYRGLMLPAYRQSSGPRCGTTSVAVTGDWGFASVPADVARGCKITVKTWLREGATFTPDGDVIRFERVGRVPQDVLDGLQHYLLPVV